MNADIEIAKLIEALKCEIGLWLDGEQTPLKTLLNIRKILNVQ